MKIKATRLRQNIYKILDEAIETGVPVEIDRKGKTLKIVPQKKAGKLDQLKKHDCMKDDPENYVHLDWSSEWQGDI